jgi:hypothetical protein
MEVDVAAWLDPSLIEALTYHILLPPKCPHQREDNLADIDNSLLRLTYECAIAFTAQLDLEDMEAWRPVVKSLSQWYKIQQGPSLDQDMLNDTMSSLIPGGELDCYCPTWHIQPSFFYQYIYTLVFVKE